MAQQTATPRRMETYASVRELILSGELPAGTRIVESGLCEELGVSRTPMREALFRLEQEGLVKQDMARGFSVMPLSAREVREIYPIIWTLEVLALQLAENDIDVNALKSLNRSLRKSNLPEKQHEIDDRFHEELVAGCKNKRLLKQIEVLKQAAHRYEMAYMRFCDKVETSVEHHDELVTALEQRNVKKALRLLEDHWRFGMESLLKWLDWQEG
jgi:DNA-binding GntR family transcriptional regulator